jgi:ACR3 family arsenite efflux pump ArsB
MGLFERYLSIWVALCIMISVLLGNLVPEMFKIIAGLAYAHVNLVVAVLIWIMIYPMMVQTQETRADTKCKLADQDQPPCNNTQLPISITIVLKVLKNALGVVSVLAGLAILLLSGQDILTLLGGLLLLDYPGRFHFEKKFISRPKILKLVNWICRRHNKKGLKL